MDAFIWRQAQCTISVVFISHTTVPIQMSIAMETKSKDKKIFV